MKVISTINFKGGVGKTTLTWLLAKHASERYGKKVLVVDSDAQMSLTTALSLDEEKGSYIAGFDSWYSEHKKRNKTLLDALVKYDEYASGNSPHFNFPIDSGFIYEATPNLHFVPSVEDLYWIELELFNPEQVKGFIEALLGKIAHSGRAYDLVLFDCPPSFTALSYSILNNCTLVLIPTNPDVFAAKGLSTMVDGLRNRITPWPAPKLAVFMNKAKTYRDHLTKESAYFLQGIHDAAHLLSQHPDTNVEVLNTWIPERAAIRKAMSFGGFPEEFRSDIDHLWHDIKKVVSI